MKPSQKLSKNEKIRRARLGTKLPDYLKKKISEAMKGNKNSLGKNMNETNGRWKGDKASYQSKHMWIYKRLGKANKCELNNCKANIYHWANISKKYKRDEKDYVSLCPTCHSFLDRNNLKFPDVMEKE